MSKIVIIGSGMGGLMAGNLLAKRGHRVKIFESHSTPGGYTAGFRRKGFYFESGTLSFESSKQVFKAMQEIGVYDKISFTRQVSRWISEDFDGGTESYEAFKEMFFQAFPAEHDSLQKYFAEMDKMYCAIRVFITNDKVSVPAFISGGLKMAGVHRKYGRMTLGQFTELFFKKDSKLYRVFSGLGYPEMSASIIGGAVATIFDDYWTVKDGMQSWADVLVENFEKLGGELHLRSYVDSIITRDGAAVGVTCNGETHTADYIISAGDYKQTFLKLLDNKSIVPAPFLKKIQENKVSEGMATVYLGLSLPNDRLREYMKVPLVFYMDLVAGANIHDPSDRDYFKKAGVGLYSPSLYNPELAPAGKSTLMLQNIAPTGWMDNWGGGDKDKYPAFPEFYTYD
jgi:phytoene dehydrogenase-like protein